MGALREPAARVGITIPGVREARLDEDPPAIVFEALPGEPVAAGGDAAIEAMARPMGELLAAFRELPATGLRASTACGPIPSGSPPERQNRAGEEIPLPRAPSGALPRPAAVLAHGDFAPVNLLTDGTSITGLLDFEAVRLADPLFDAAWWAWSVSFSSALETSWPAFLEGTGLDDDPERVRALQVLRMLELVAEGHLEPGIHRVVADRLRTELPLVVEDRQVEPRQALRIGQRVDLDDPAPGDGEAHDRERPAARAPRRRRPRRSRAPGGRTGRGGRSSSPARRRPPRRGPRASGR